MSKKTIADTINDSFDKLIDKLGLKKDDKTSKALENFTTAITDALNGTEGEGGITEEAVRKVINTTLEKFKKEHVDGNSYDDSALQNEIKDLKVEVEALKDQIAEGAVPPKPDGEDGDDGVKDYTKGVVFN